jgi:X-linked retinitis pigmentosa GTPase regulator
VGNLYGTGLNDNGRLGEEEKEMQVVPKMIGNLIGEAISNVSCGNEHTIIVTESGKVWGTGRNSKAELGIGNKNQASTFVQNESLKDAKIVKVSCGHHTAAISSVGEIYIWGTGVFGEYLVPKKLEGSGAKFKEVCIGSAFGLSLDESGKVWTWGANTSGELGVGDYEPHAEPFMLSKLQSKTVTTAACGGSFAIALGVTHKSSGQKPEERQKIELAEELKNEQPPIPQNEEQFLKDQDQSNHPESGTPSVSDLNNAEVSSSVSQRDPNMHVFYSFVTHYSFSMF